MPNDALQPEQVARLREGLAVKGWSQADLAHAIKKRDSTISAILGGNSGPRTSTFKAICDALRLNPGYVMFGIEPRFIEPQKTPSSTELKPVAMSLGVDLWLADTPDGRSTSAAERDAMRAVPWPNPFQRYSNETYLLILTGLRQALNANR